MFEALAVALPRGLEGKQALLAAWSGGAPVERTLVVPAQLGDLEVSFRVPFARAMAKAVFMGRRETGYDMDTK